MANTKTAKQKKLPPIHPGEILEDAFSDAGISANAVALALRIPANRLTQILRGKRSISADTALRLARFFGTSAQMWIGLQSMYDLRVAEEALADVIEAEVMPMKAMPS